MKSRVLLIDDHAILRQGIALLVNREADLHVCCEAEDAESALKANMACPHDIAIIDLSLASASGLAVVRKMSTCFPKLRILMLSMHAENLYADSALQAGAHGYLMKQESPSILLLAIRQILNGELYVSDRMRTRLLQDIAQNNNCKSPIAGLTSSEFEVFRLIGEGVGPSKIAEILNRSVKTIEKHRSNIKHKLQIRDGHHLTRFAMQWIQNGSSIVEVNDKI